MRTEGAGFYLNEIIRRFAVEFPDDGLPEESAPVDLRLSRLLPIHLRRGFAAHELLEFVKRANSSPYWIPELSDFEWRACIASACIASARLLLPEGSDWKTDLLSGSIIGKDGVLDDGYMALEKAFGPKDFQKRADFYRLVESRLNSFREGTSRALNKGNLLLVQRWLGADDCPALALMTNDNASLSWSMLRESVFNEDAGQKEASDFSRLKRKLGLVSYPRAEYSAQSKFIKDRSRLVFSRT